METWVTLDGSVFVSQSPHFCSYTLFRMCSCISTHTYVNLSFKSCFIPFAQFAGTWVPLCGIVCLSLSPYCWSHTLVTVSTCIITCIYVHLTSHVRFTHSPSKWSSLLHSEVSLLI